MLTVLTEPPYQVRETGYAGFDIPIEVHFKNKDKPNSLKLVHDLVLLTDKPNQTSRIEKVTFINPSKDFEKCLVKSGAQLLPNLKKKERSGSPPAKKQKSSSLIPSKDMSKQFQTTPISGTAITTITPTPISSSVNNTTASGSQGAPAKASKNSKEFIDMFGAPLVFGGQSTQSSQPTVSQTSSTTTAQPRVESSTSTQNKQSQHHHHHHNHNSNHNHNHSHQTTSKEEPQTTKNHHHNNHSSSSSNHHQQHNNHLNHQTTKQERSEDQPVDELQLIQTKISSLTDSNRLQKIVDIIEEAGEWFNLTSKKFEFDLKRLDKKTLSRIERCLH